MSVDFVANRGVYAIAEKVEGFDRKHGVETSSMLQISELDVGDNVGALAYQACSPALLRHTLSQLSVDRTMSFIDIGCGKGRALIVASQYPFANVIGVELSPKLVEVARDNMRRAGVAARVIESDARTFELPDGDLVLFFYNPFVPRVLEEVLTRMGPFAQGRRLFVIFQNDRGARRVLDGCAWLRLMERGSTYGWFGSWSMYRSVA